MPRRTLRSRRREGTGYSTNAATATTSGTRSATQIKPERLGLVWGTVAAAWIITNRRIAASHAGVRNAYRVCTWRSEFERGSTRTREASGRVCRAKLARHFTDHVDPHHRLH